ncbi:unknown [Mycoplasma sp. CAG:472]|jgi:hypothetical protein|nr:unknown [Mycoplasma sp. CAG:472]
MDKFERLKDIIRNKKNDFNINNFVLDTKGSKSNISDYAIDYKQIEKHPYIINLLTYEKSIPEKKKNYGNKLDYEMNKYYFLKLYINKEEELLEITLNKSSTKKDIHLLFLKYLDKINFLNINDFLEYLFKVLQ